MYHTNKFQNYDRNRLLTIQLSKTHRCLQIIFFKTDFKIRNFRLRIFKKKKISDALPEVCQPGMHGILNFIGAQPEARIPEILSSGKTTTRRK